MAKPWKGAITVEQAAERAEMTPRQLCDLAVIGGFPKGFGPFSSVDGSSYRIFIDEGDLNLWLGAGKPVGRSYRERGEVGR